MHFYSLRMIESPVNPISSKSLEITHVTWGTYPFINALFFTVQKYYQDQVVSHSI